MTLRGFILLLLFLQEAYFRFGSEHQHIKNLHQQSVSLQFMMSSPLCNVHNTEPLHY